jgi:hypothetical protein
VPKSWQKMRLNMFAATWTFARSWCPAINVVFRGGGGFCSLMKIMLM